MEYTADIALQLGRLLQFKYYFVLINYIPYYINNRKHLPCSNGKKTVISTTNLENNF